jgi:hypothetical protein
LIASVGFGECNGATLMYSFFEYLVSRPAAFAILFTADVTPRVFLLGVLDAIVVAPLTRPLHLSHPRVTVTITQP